ncbi:hypothetical protein H5410_035567 [Solanum commersonii]|uniref:Uncharacterized protein n=1 Tax=Solanum commersonii TaxID=4109 RepID=A0A9J5Y385_SOLCO|nr:hypothetical protein H5410_035567 [Solanum commersonii]
MASQGMSMLSKGKEKINLMIINMNLAGLLSFQLLDQAVALDIVSICICDEYDVRSAKKAFESGAYFYMQKPLHQGFVKYLWQLVLQKNIQEGKTIDVIDNINIVGDNEEQHVEENNVPINIDEQGNDIHETTNDVVSNEKSKFRRKKGRKLTEEAKSQSSATKVIIRRKTRIIWTVDLHDKFQEAVNKLNDGRCFPSDILEAMNVPGLTRYQVASHLQKCRNHTWKAPRKRKSTCHHSSGQLGISSGSSSLGIFETTSHLKMNVTNLQQQYDQETQRGQEISFLPNNNIFARGESSSLHEVYHQQHQVDPQYLNPFDTPLLSSAENNNLAGLQQQHGPLSELLGLEGSNIGSVDHRPELGFNNGIPHAQNDYALDVAIVPDTNITNSAINGLGVANIDFQQHIGELQGSNIGSTENRPELGFNNGIPHAQNDYPLDTNIENSTLDGLGVANIDFQQHIGGQNMAQPADNIVTTSHVSDTQGSESSEMMDCDAYFDFDNLDFLFQNNEPPSFDLPNEHDSLFDQVYSDDMPQLSEDELVDDVPVRGILSLKDVYQRFFVLLIDDDKEFSSEIIHLLESHEYKDICDEYDARSAKKAFESGAYFYMQKPLYKEFVKYMWQVVLQKNIQEGKAIDVIDNINIVGDNEELYVEENNVPIDIDKQDNDIHETSNDVVSNEKCKLKRKRGCFPSDILEAMNVPSLTRPGRGTGSARPATGSSIVSLDPVPSILAGWGDHGVRFNTNDSTYVDDTSYAIESNVQLDHEILQQIYGDISPYLNENSGEEVEVGSGEEELKDTPTSPVTEVPNETTNSTEQNCGRLPLIPPTREKVKYQCPKTSVVWQFITLDNENSIAICNKYYRPELGFNNGIHPAQNDYALDVVTYATVPDTNIANPTINGMGVANIDFQQQISELQGSNIGSADYTPGIELNNGIHHAQPANNIVTTSHVSDTQGSESSEMMDCDAYFDFDNLDFLFLNNEPPSFDLPNEHDSLFDQVYSDDMVFVMNNDVRQRKKAFESGAYFYMQKPLHQGFVKYLWQLVLQKNIQEGKSIDVIDNINIVGDNEEQHVEENNVPINIDEQGNDIHETTNDVVSNEKSKFRRKKGRKLTEEAKSQSSATKVIIRRKTRIIWTVDLHDKFQEAVNKLNDGRCFPSDILEAMNVPGLTRYQVASHLQKCRNHTWKAPRKRKSTCHHSSGQLGISSGSSSLGIFETTSHLKMNVTNLQQQYDQETQRGQEISFLPNNNIFARGESSSLHEVYHQQHQVDPQYLNPFDTPLLSSAENNNLAGLQQQHGPLSELLGLEGSNIGSVDHRPELGFNNGIPHAQNDYPLDTNITNSTINGLGVANIDFQQYIGGQNMAQPADNIVTTSHVSDTQGSESSEMMDCDAYFDFDNLDFLLLNNEPPSFDLPNEHDSLFDQVYSDDMVSVSI